MLNKAVLMRFVRVFVSGFLAGVVTYLSAGVPPKELADWQFFAMPLMMAGVTAGFAALDKALRYKEPQAPDFEPEPKVDE